MENPIDIYNQSNTITGEECCLSGTELPEGVTLDHSRCCKLKSFNWLKDYQDPNSENKDLFVEVRFKNGRKDFFICTPELNLKEGEIVAVEANPGHEIGIVSLTGEVVRLQMKRKKVDPEKTELKKIYRHARSADIEKWFESIALEDSALFKTKKIVDELGLDMKLNDVEYQGDKTKAIFYYTANERVDFRILIRRLAEEFKVRVEMRQIGARQEASKLGGIGSCGRELCCSSHMSNFKSVSTNSARVQQLSLNPQKLAGQCGKLKCCLNYELDHYLEILEEFSDPKIVLKSKKGNAVHQKSDIFKRVMLYSYVNDPNSMLVIPVDQVKNIIEMNQRGKLPDELEIYAQQTQQVVSEESSAENEGYVSYI
ncbi:MAG: hypothetical protein IH595_00625 [Bacteroidales bacterium]|nr:hypothetical protein [Bacteroidales bacterium]